MGKLDKAWPILLAAVCLSAPSWAQQARVCGARSGAGLSSFEDSAKELGAGVSGVTAAAVRQVYSFPDVQKLADASGSVCVTAMPVAKNIYQYDEFLVVIAGRDKGGEWTLPLMFQAASVQAYENLGAKPWLGFPRGDLTSTVRGALADAELKERALEPGEAFSPIGFLPALFPPSPGSAASASDRGYVFVPDVEAGWSTYLVSQLRALTTGNVFTSQSLLDAGVVQVQEASGRVRAGVLRGFFGVYTGMERLQAQSAPPDLRDGDARAQRLHELIR